jgi:hypothetical protein
MVQLLLHAQKMDPLVSLYYFAPVCAGFNLVLLPFTEGLSPIRNFQLIGPVLFLANGANTFALNVSAVFLVGAASSLVLTLSGVFKVRLLVGLTT